MNIRRRGLIRMLAGTGALLGASVLMPGIAQAAWRKQAFFAEDQHSAMQALLGGSQAAQSSEVVLTVPDIAENGAVVPVTVRTTLANVETVSIFIENNPYPLAAQFRLPPGTGTEVSTRLRMGKTSRVTAVVNADGVLYSAEREVKVTIGGCGG